MRNLKVLSCLFTLCLLATACGEDTSKDSGDAGGDGDSSSSSGDGDSSSSSGDGDSTSTTTGDGDGDSMDPMCDETATNVDSCGDETCEAPTGQFAEMGCQVSCCVDNMCGTRITSMNSMVPDQLRNCALPPELDERCPDGDFMNMTLAGCCTTDGNCGVSAGNNCFDPSSFMGGDPLPCDEAGDAGI